MRCMCVVLLLAGCSTMENVGVGLEGHNPNASCQPFGGTQASTARVTEGVDSIRRSGLQFYVPVITECMGLCVLADVPLSFAGDVVTLPYCLYRASTVHPPGAFSDQPAVSAAGTNPQGGGMP